MEGEIPLPRSVSTHIICCMLLLFIWAKAVKSQVVEVQKRFEYLQWFNLPRLCGMYLIAIDKKSLKTVHSLVLQSPQG